MATAITNARTLEWVDSSDGTQPVVKIYAEGTSETFNAGDLVIYDASEDGVVEIAQGDGGVFGDSTDDEVADVSAFLGIALTAATGTSGSQIEVLIPRPQDIFAAVMFATDFTTMSAPVIDDIGTLVDFIKADTANNFTVGVLRGTNAGLFAKVIDICRQDTELRGGAVGNEPTYSAGDRVLVKFQSSILDAAGYQA
jgi:hypothetical protein